MSSLCKTKECNSSNQTSNVTNVPSTKVGKTLGENCNATVINMTKATSDEDYNQVVNQVSNLLSKKDGPRMIVIEEPAIKPTLDSSMLASYHPKNGGKLKNFTKVWFDQSTTFYERLVNSGINYPSEWFMLVDLPDDPNGSYRLAGSVGGSVTVSGLDKIISKKRVPNIKF